MSATLTVPQLKSALTNDQIVKARTTGIGEGETIDVVAEEITAACAKVDTYCAGYVVPEGLTTGWARELAAHNVAKRLGTPTPDQVRTFERTNTELEDLRDGKFPNIAKVAGATAGKVISGSRPKVL
ncbi:MAG: hypothetical protein ABIS50_15125 [Luteolibacter sp.]|uniref:hypothetical protein n=1 Tax=Luteolibacter sp. TaxID=1962973 RepID=UPI0032633A06